MTKTILHLLEEKQYSKLKEYLNLTLVPDIAEMLEELSEKDLIFIFKLLSKDKGAEVFSYIDSSMQELVVKTLTDKELSAMIDMLDIDDTVDFIKEMPANIVERVLKNSTKETREDINKLLKYDENTAGSIMTTEFIDLKKSTTVSDAFKRIRKMGNSVETINVLYVTDKQRVLEGVVSIKDLLLAEPKTLIEDIMETSLVFETTSTDKEKITQVFSKYDMLALPIVDNEQRLVGIVTVDDAMEVLEEETTEDFEKMSGLAPSDQPYLKTNSLTLAKKRVVWLSCLMISAVFTSILITAYESVFAAVPALVACMPMLMGTGGNCGTQASTLIIRGMALNEIKFKDYFSVFFKETRVSIIIGVFLCALNFVIVFLQQGNALIALTVASTLFLVILIANFLGFSLPIFAKKIKLDPAVMATPVLTTILDCCVVLIYFNIASLIIGI